MTARPTAPVADICLYGSRRCGHGYLAATADGRRFGDGEPRSYLSATDALWLAACDLRDAGIAGVVRVFEPTGERMATMDLADLRTVGQLDWTPAPVLTIAYADIVALAARD